MSSKIKIKIKAKSRLRVKVNVRFGVISLSFEGQMRPKKSSRLTIEILVFNNSAELQACGNVESADGRTDIICPESHSEYSRGCDSPSPAMMFDIFRKL